jgi:hypothetical protein
MESCKEYLYHYCERIPLQYEIYTSRTDPGWRVDEGGTEGVKFILYCPWCSTRLILPNKRNSPILV